MPYMGIKLSLRVNRMLDCKKNGEKKEKKPLAEGKASLAPATSLTYALRGYKIVAESQQDAKLLQIARVCGENKG